MLSVNYTLRQAQCDTFSFEREMFCKGKPLTTPHKDGALKKDDLGELKGD